MDLLLLDRVCHDGCRQFCALYVRTVGFSSDTLAFVGHDFHYLVYFGFVEVIGNVESLGMFLSCASHF